MQSGPHLRTRRLAVALATAVALSTAGCGDVGPRGQDRWVATENTSVDIDWDALATAYKEAEGPEDFERRVNEIYAGDEVISVAVHDVDAKTQQVTGFFDRNANGIEDPEEKVFSIQRDIVSDAEAQYQVQGHGPYMGYHSPMMSVASGMLMGAMLSNVFSPGYRPMYAQPYVTPVGRRGALASQRDSYRQNNPSKFRSGKTSQSGKQYGAKGNAFGGGRPTTAPSRSPMRSPMRGGGRFGLQPRGARRLVVLGERPES